MNTIHVHGHTYAKVAVSIPPLTYTYYATDPPRAARPLLHWQVRHGQHPPFEATVLFDVENPVPGGLLNVGDDFGRLASVKQNFKPTPISET